MQHDFPASVEKELESFIQSHTVGEIFDEDLFLKNLKALGKHDPILAKEISEKEKSWENIKVFMSKSGAPGFTYNGRQLCSAYDPISEAEQVADASLEDGYGVIVGFGFGMGYHLPALIESKQVTQLFVYEPSIDALVGVFGIVDLSDYLSNSKLKIVTDPQKLFFNVPYAEKLKPAISKACLPGYISVFPEYLKILDQRLDNLIKNMDMIVGTMLQKDTEWFKFLVDNFPRYCDMPNIGNLKNKFQGVPGIIVAAGPSLDKNYKLLKEAKGKGLIISVGTSIRKVSSLGISPDITIVLESNDIMYQFDGAEHMDQGYLALSISCFPELFDLPFKGTFCYSGSGVNKQHMMELTQKKSGVIAAGGSVATAAFSLASLAGCDPIIMIGQDLAFADKGKFHADGVGRNRHNPFKKPGAKEPVNDDDLKKMSLEKVEGYYGGKVLTQSNLLNYLMWFEQSIPNITYHGREVINCTEGGARIKGALQMSFAEAIEKYLVKDVPVMDLLAKAAQPDPLDRKTGKRTFGRLLSKTKQLTRQAKEEMDLVEATFDMLNKKYIDEEMVNKKVHRINQIEKKIKVACKELDNLISPLINQESLIATKCFEYDELDEPQSLKQNMRQSHVLYKGIHKAAKILTESLSRIHKFLGQEPK